MLTKIISVKNVGRFLNSATTPNPQLAKHTFIAGANGFGKTTICAVLRSLHTGDGSHIVGRKTLGASDGMSVELLFDTGPLRFNGTAWSAPRPTFAIFDGVFVGENVHAGEIVDVVQKRNLYRIIVGEVGVRLAQEDADLTAASRQKTSELTVSTRSLQPHLTSGISLDQFVALTPVEDVDAEITAQAISVEALRQADILNKRSVPSTLPVPTFPSGLVTLLNKTIDDIASDAEGLLDSHLKAHNMGPGASNWISTGVEYANNDCPFCGQGIEGLPLVSAFKAVFSQRFKDLQTEVSAMRAMVADQLGDASLANQAVVAERNHADSEFWQRYVSFDWRKTTLPQEFCAAASNLRTQALVPGIRAE